jgi:predicted alpha/beta hydrolase
MIEQQNIEGEVVEVQSGDGARSAITIYRNDTDSLKAAVICNPAMGVSARYYHPLALALHERGLNVITSDLRGLGLSSIRVSAGTDFGYNEILSFDMPAVVEVVRRELPGRRIFLLGHSLGGQLNCLYTSLRPDSVAGIILIATCSLYYRGWPFPKSVGIYLFEHFARIVTDLLGYFPGRSLGFAGQESRKMMRDWSHQGLTGRYEVAGNPHDFESLLSEMELPVLSISLDDDSYAPRGAVLHLINKMRAAAVTDINLKPADFGLAGLGHFGWVKNATLIAPYIVSWINDVTG